jgi:hypothetical protein
MFDINLPPLGRLPLKSSPLFQYKTSRLRVDLDRFLRLVATIKMWVYYFRKKNSGKSGPICQEDKSDVFTTLFGSYVGK